MKKSSRDYRKRNRKKWIRINTKSALIAIVAAQAIAQYRIIISTPGDKNLRAKAILDLITNTRQSIMNIATKLLPL